MNLTLPKPEVRKILNAAHALGLSDETRASLSERLGLEHPPWRKVAWVFTCPEGVHKFDKLTCHHSVPNIGRRNKRRCPECPPDRIGGEE